jgi:hypothetical protein
MTRTDEEKRAYRHDEYARYRAKHKEEIRVRDAKYKADHREENFRFNNRTTNDAKRFALALSGISGKRLTYDQLTAKQAYKQLRMWKRLK